MQLQHLAQQLRLLLQLAGQQLHQLSRPRPRTRPSPRLGSRAPAPALGAEEGAAVLGHAPVDRGVDVALQPHGQGTQVPAPAATQEDGNN